MTDKRSDEFGKAPRRDAGFPYLIVKREAGGAARAIGPVDARSAEVAVKNHFEDYDEDEVGGYDVEVYPVGVTIKGDVEKIDIHVGDVL